MLCPICQAVSIPFKKALVLGKYDVQYFQCPGCNFICTEEPFWLEEAYGAAIATSDIGLVGRNLTLARKTKAIISLFFDSNKRFLDYGGGYGLFVRLMRDKGLDFYHYDKNCRNLFAQSFEADMGAGSHYELATAYEVLEHLVRPMEEILRILELSQNMLFSTVLLPADHPAPADWWYYGPDHGQHVSIYALKTLHVIAERVGLNLFSDGASLHLLSPRKIPKIGFRLASRGRIAWALDTFWKRASLLPEDYFGITGRPLR
jgi:hypothetical protein